MGVEGKDGWVKKLKDENGISVVALQETLCRDVGTLKVASFWGRKVVEWEAVESSGHSGGLLTLWDPSIFVKCSMEGPGDIVLSNKFRFLRNSLREWKASLDASEGEELSNLKAELENLESVMETRDLNVEEEWVFSALEVEEWIILSSKLEQSVIGRGPDSWTWSGSCDGNFSVSNMKFLIREARGYGTFFKFKWVSWVPLKCNILAWRAEMDRIPTVPALARRNIRVDNDVCSLCDTDVETTRHLFMGCGFSFGV
ncbi:RNA-directed DNA polymerase, eukaryota [Artemisia annua]|uniref:RNA-directed DNA polymerase, eukaryota n=1 Tax=Artemisia annua TaxID=35608 RepID=A0A2U1KGR6_ARTAN|nr:RNA-directed DNA polymerase, eukaryota [Artemisia annua]